jgi:hypothetical protein
MAASSLRHDAVGSPVSLATLSVAESIKTVLAPAWSTLLAFLALSMMLAASGAGTRLAPVLASARNRYSRGSHWPVQTPRR